MVGNVKSMLRLAKAFGSETISRNGNNNNSRRTNNIKKENKNITTNTVKKESNDNFSNDSYPNFFI